MEGVLSRALPAIASGLILGGCFTTRPATIGELRTLSRATDIRMTLKGGDVVRARVAPEAVGDETIRYNPLRHGPESWVVSWAGWPAVWSAGKYWRHEIAGDATEIPIEDLEAVSIERYSGLRTLLSLPVTLIPGILDYIFNYVQFGFRQNDFDFDIFSRAPPGKPIIENDIPPAPGPAPPESPPPPPPP